MRRLALCVFGAVLLSSAVAFDSPLDHVELDGQKRSKEAIELTTLRGPDHFDGSTPSTTDQDSSTTSESGSDSVDSIVSLHRREVTGDVDEEELFAPSGLKEPRAEGFYELILLVCDMEKYTVREERVAVLYGLSKCIRNPKDNMPFEIYKRALELSGENEVSHETSWEGFKDAVYMSARYWDQRFRFSREDELHATQVYSQLVGHIYEGYNEKEMENNLLDEEDALVEAFGKVLSSYMHAVAPRPSPEEAKKADAYWTPFSPDFSFEMSMVYYLDHMKHPTKLFARFNSETREQREEAWTKYRTKIVDQVKVDVHRMNEYELILEKPSATSQECSEMARGFGTAQTNAECTRRDATSGCLVSCRFSYEELDEETSAKAAMTDFTAALQLVDRQYEKSEVDLLVSRAYKSTVLFDPSFEQRCDPNTSDPYGGLDLLCLHEMEALMLLWHSTQMVGNALNEVVMDKMGKGYGMNRPYPDIATYQLGPKTAKMHRKYLFVLGAMDEDYKRIELPVRIDVKLEETLSMAVDLRFDLLDNMKGFRESFGSDNLMKNPEWELPPEVSLYDNASKRGRVWHLTHYVPGTLLARLYMKSYQKLYRDVWYTRKW